MENIKSVMEEYLAVHSRLSFSLWIQEDLQRTFIHDNDSTDISLLGQI